MKKTKMTWVCCECSHVFQRAVMQLKEVRCPKCRSADIDLAPTGAFHIPSLPMLPKEGVKSTRRD